MITPAEARQRWQDARSFDELCELGAQFVEGRLPYSSGYCAENLDDESASLIGPLARFNRAGFLTTGSQPGCIEIDSDGATWKQRAFVDGYAMPPVAEKLARVSLQSDVIIITVGPGEASTLSIPGSQSDGEPTLWMGTMSRRCGDDFDEVCTRAVVDILESQALFVQLFDPRWGRKSYLWKQVDAALREDS